MKKEISNPSQVSYIRRYQMTSGREDGLKVIEVYNGVIRYLINESKGMDIMQLFHKGTNISFLSKNAFNSKDIDFLKRFEGGMLYTSGIDSCGGREGYPIHGTFHLNQAEITRCEMKNDELVVEGIIRDTALFGKNLVMRRRIKTTIGSDKLTLEDTLVNEGYKEEDYSILYHVNVGYPMLEPGCKINAKLNGFKPRTPWAEEKKEEIFDITEPLDNQEETCYFLDTKEPKVSLTNEKLGKKFIISYSKDTLPYFIEWKSMASGDYALGLEPASTELDEGFKYKKIKPQEKIDFKVELKVKEL